MINTPLSFREHEVDRTTRARCERALHASRVLKKIGAGTDTKTHVEMLRLDAFRGKVLYETMQVVTCSMYTCLKHDLRLDRGGGFLRKILNDLVCIQLVLCEIHVLMPLSDTEVYRSQFEIAQPFQTILIGQRAGCYNCRITLVYHLNGRLRHALLSPTIILCSDNCGALTPYDWFNGLEPLFSGPQYCSRRARH